MTLSFILADDHWVLIPTIAVSRGECTDPQCGEAHGLCVEFCFLNLEFVIETDLL
jgi:hypothetical protein